MIAQLMIYGIEVAVLVSCAAWAIERVAIWRGFARRGCWAAALVLSVGIPVISILMPPKTPAQPAVTPVAMVSPDTPARSIAAPPAPAQRIHFPTEYPAPESSTQHPGTVTLETALVAAWCAGTCALLITYLFLTVRLRQAARNWHQEQIDGQQVWITDSLGPAVYGFLIPIILLPRWLLQADVKERAAA
jgi:beta-lactamase regulating signal transducer with metallopeptidase domain